MVGYAVAPRRLGLPVSCWLRLRVHKRSFYSVARGLWLRRVMERWALVSSCRLWLGIWSSLIPPPFFQALPVCSCLSRLSVSDDGRKPDPAIFLLGVFFLFDCHRRVCFSQSLIWTVLRFSELGFWRWILAWPCCSTVAWFLGDSISLEIHIPVPTYLLDMCW